jgi:hypothetical protein
MFFSVGGFTFGDKLIQNGAIGNAGHAGALPPFR